MTAIANFELTELERIEDWRRHVLTKDGKYPQQLARDLAEKPHVDLHRAVKLAQDGCPHDLAARILL